MIGAPELLEAADALVPLRGEDFTAEVDRFLRKLPRHKPKMPSNAPRLTYPSRPACACLEPELIRVANGHGREALSALMATLVAPRRAYPLESHNSGRFILMSSFNGGLVVSATVQVSRTRVDLEATLLFEPTVKALAVRLEMLHLAPSVPAGDHQRASSRRVLLVADAGRMGAELGAGWKQVVVAACESWGYDVEFCETPITDRALTMKTMDMFGGVALLVPVFAAGGFVEARHPRWRHRSVPLDGPQRVALLDELRINFELGLVDPPRVETWSDFSKRADELETECFLLTDHCRDGLQAPGYEDAARLWLMCERLSEGARRRRECGWRDAGTMADFLRSSVGLEVALFDSALGDTSFSYEGQTLSWEPHVKVDDHKHGRVHVGRIYFAIDDQHERLVIWHIGSKL